MQHKKFASLVVCVDVLFGHFVQDSRGCLLKKPLGFCKWPYIIIIIRY